MSRVVPPRVFRLATKHDDWVANTYLLVRCDAVRNYEDGASSSGRMSAFWVLWLRQELAVVVTDGLQLLRLCSAIASSRVIVSLRSTARGQPESIE